jgi:anti-sigma factor RsiW
MNDIDVSVCKFSTDIVPYMYGELSAAESSVFESHLLDCGACTDEFAVISNARYEIYEWKKLEFDPLATPRFEIPASTEPVYTGSWAERFRTAFGQRWAIPSLAFAGLAAVAVMSAVIMFQDGSTEVVGVNESSSAAVSSSPDVMPAVAVAAVIDEDDGSAGPPEVSKPAKVASSQRREPRRVVRSSRRIQPRTTEVRSVSAENRNAPRLNDFAEDEDTSLRLAELFEDIGTSE